MKRSFMKKITACVMVFAVTGTLWGPAAEQAVAKELFGNQQAAIQDSTVPESEREMSLLEIREDEPGLLDQKETAGELIVGVTYKGAMQLPDMFSDYDIVFNTLLDASSAVKKLSGKDREDIIGTSETPDGCRILSAQSATLSTEELVSLLQNAEGVLYVEENLQLAVTDTTVSKEVSDEEIPDNAETESDETAQTSVEETQEPKTVTSPIIYSKSDKATTDTYNSYQWALNNYGQLTDGVPGCDINIGDAHGSSDVVIAVMDYGIDYEHPGMKNKMIDLSEYGSIMADTGCGRYGYDSSNNTDHTDTMDYSDTSHGTCCAGIIGGADRDNEGKEVGPRGVMDAVTLLAVKTSYTTQSILTSAGWMIEAKNTYGVNIAAVSLSMGGKSSRSTRLAFAALDEAEITICKSSGNNNEDLDQSPGWDEYDRADSTIIVNSVDATSEKSWFSNYGKITDIFAPGSYLLSDKTGQIKNVWSSYTGAMTGHSLLYTGFDDPDNESFIFKTDNAAMTAVSDEHFYTGGQSLKISGAQGSVALESEPVNIDVSGCSSDSYFQLSTIATSGCLIYELIRVKDINTGESHFEKLEVQKSRLSDGNPADWGMVSHRDGIDFDKQVQELSAGSTITLNDAYRNASGRFISLDSWEDYYGSEAGWTIDWENFQIRLEVVSLNSTVTDSVVTDVPWEGEVYIDTIGLGTDDQSDICMTFTGTSAAAPVVVGAYGLVYAKYGKMGDTDVEYECNDKLSARIVGSANSSYSGLAGYCRSDGMVDVTAALSEDETSFAPVLQSYETGNDTITFRGWFLGGEGDIYIDGVPAEILSYTPDTDEAVDDTDNAGTIVVRLPVEYSGYKTVEYVNAEGRVGRIYADMTHSYTDYQRLSVPDEEMMGDTRYVFLNAASDAVEMYCVGSSNIGVDNLICYDRASDTWAKLAEVPSQGENVYMPPVFFKGDYYGLTMLYEKSGMPYAQQLCRLDLKGDGTGEWKAVGEPMVGLFMSCLASCGDKLIMVSGLDLNIWEYSEKVSELCLTDEGCTALELFTAEGLAGDVNCKMQYENGTLWLFDAYGTDNFSLWKLDIEGMTAEKIGLYMEGTVSDPSNAPVAATPSGLIINSRFEGQKDYTDTWFFNTGTKELTVSELMLDTLLEGVKDSVTLGNTTYVVGKASDNRDDSSHWFFRSLDYEKEGPSAEWTKGSKTDVAVTIGIAPEYLTEKAVTLDGKALTEGADYTLNMETEQKDEDASADTETVLTLKEALLTNLETGVHAVRVPFNIEGRDMTVICSLNVKEAGGGDDPDPGKDDPSKKKDQPTGGNANKGNSVYTGDSLSSVTILMWLVLATAAGVLSGAVIWRKKKQ